MFYKYFLFVFPGAVFRMQASCQIFKRFFFLLDTDTPAEKSLVICQNLEIQDAKNQTKQGTSLPLRLVCYISITTGFIYLYKSRPRDMEGKNKGLGTSVPPSPRMILNIVLFGQNNVVLSFLLAQYICFFLIFFFPPLSKILEWEQFY